MEFSLQLRHRLNRQHDTAAVLISGDDASRWISAVQHLDVPSSQLRFLVVHENTDSASRTIGAVCVFPPGFVWQNVGHVDGLQYGCLADCLFLPIEASLYPEVIDHELQTLLPDDPSRLFVWHPSAGLIGFDPEHILTVGDLLSPPKIADVSWLTPVPDEQINRHIRSLLPEPTLDIGDILNGGQDDIGTEADNLDKAPRSPDEQGAEVIRDSLKALKKSIARAVHSLTSKLPSSENGNRTLGRLHNWAESWLNAGRTGGRTGSSGSPRRPDAGMTTRRENEIKRLLNLLKNDPDKGLKYALPMGGGDSSRGAADATDRLGARDINFNPSRMFTSGPADAWDLPWEYQIQLLHEYRQLAQREQQLGRYRRAAYIYAQLLGDFPAAAAALEAGRYYHDAATIYLEHINDPLKAANSLRAGGFWEESAMIYKNRELWIEAGELYQQLDQVEEAQQMFGNAIRDCEIKRNYAGAASIADKRLNDPEQASELFVTGWMQAANGRTCLFELLTMLGRRGMHDNARQTLRQVTDTDYLALDQVDDALAVCSQNAEHYPDESVRNDSRKHCWRLAATLLNRTDEFAGPEHKSALAAVRNLAPTDRLLQTDSQRHQLQQQAQQEASGAASAAPLRSSARSGNVAKLIGRYPLIPEGTEAGTVWTQICCNGSFLYRIGCNYDLFVVRQAIGSRRDGRIATQDDVCRLPRPAAVSYKDFRLRLDSGNPDQAWLFTAAASVSQSHPTLHQKISECSFLNVPYEGDGQMLDIEGTSSGWQHSLVLNDGMEGPAVEFRVVNYLNLADQAISVGIPSPRGLQESPTSVRMLSHSGRFYSVMKEKVVVITVEPDLFAGHKPRPDYSANVLTTLPFAPSDAVVSPSATMARLVFSFDIGALAIWPDADQSCSFASDLASPLLTFSLNGILAAACRQTHVIEFWRLNAGEAVLHASYQCDDAIVHLTCGPAPNQILAFHSDGSVSQLSIPVR